MQEKCGSILTVQVLFMRTGLERLRLSTLIRFHDLMRNLFSSNFRRLSTTQKEINSSWFRYFSIQKYL